MTSGGQGAYINSPWEILPAGIQDMSTGSSLSQGAPGLIKGFFTKVISPKIGCMEKGCDLLYLPHLKVEVCQYLNVENE
jgi:hypothetical protein